MKLILSLSLLFITSISYPQIQRLEGKREIPAARKQPQQQTATTQLPAPDPKAVASYNWWRYINPTNVNNLSSFTNVSPVNYDTGFVAYSKRTAISLAGWMNHQINLVAATNGDSLAHLQPLIRLEQLMVNGFISDRGLSHIRQLKSLKELQVAVTGSMNDYITDQGLDYIGELTNLQKLYLYSCPNVTDKGLSYITTLSNLRELVLLHSKVSDAGIGYLNAFPMLEILNLSRTPGVTDKSIPALIDIIRKMKYFKKLIISFTGISEDGRKRLSDAGIPFVY